MPRTTRASLAAAFAASVASSSSATCVSPTPGDRKATAMFRKRQRDWRQEDDASEPVALDEQLRNSIHHHTATPRVLLGRPDHHPPSPHASSRQRRRRLSDDDRSSWKRADHDQLLVGEPRDHDLRDSHSYEVDDAQHSDDDDDDSHASPFKEIQCRVEQVGQQVARAQRNVAELRALLRQAITTQRKASATRALVPTTTTTAKARVRIDMLCS